MLNNTFKAVTVLSLVLAVLMFIPTMIFCAVTGTDYVYSFLYVILFCLISMVVFPIPVYLILKKEQRFIDQLKSRVGKGCFVSKVAFIDNETGKGTHCYLCFNDSKLLLVAKKGKFNAYLDLNKSDLESISVNPDTFDMVIKPVSRRGYKLFSPDPKLTTALEKLGWRVIEVSDTE